VVTRSKLTISAIPHRLEKLPTMAMPADSRNSPHAVSTIVAGMIVGS
jgi:hypothetical protein